MGSNWQVDKAWTDPYLPEVKRICANYLIGEAPEKEDQLRNTDLIVLKLEPVRVACRIRTPGYYEKYGDEFTIRASRPSGNCTEFTKIIGGWGDYFFYAHASESTGELRSFMLGDLREFRVWFNRQLMFRGGKIPCKQKSNVDGSSDFYAFSIAEVNEGCAGKFLVTSHLPNQAGAATGVASA